MSFSNEIYLISYFHGTSGQFMGAMTQLFLAKRQFIINFPEDGTAEDVLLPPYLNNQFRCNVDKDYDLLKHNFFDKLEPLNDKPFIIAEHPQPNWERFFSKFPNGRNLIIQLNEKMLYRQAANSYYKQKFKKIKDSILINQDLAKEAVEEKYRLFSRTQIKNEVIGYPYRDTDVIPSMYDKIFIIHLYDLIHNKMKVLETLSKFTEKPINDIIIKSYENYLEKQKKLIPWLNDE